MLGRLAPNLDQAGQPVSKMRLVHIYLELLENVEAIRTTYLSALVLTNCMCAGY